MTTAARPSRLAIAMAIAATVAVSILGARAGANDLDQPPTSDLATTTEGN